MNDLSHDHVDDDKSTVENEKNPARTLHLEIAPYGQNSSLFTISSSLYLITGVWGAAPHD